MRGGGGRDLEPGIVLATTLMYLRTGVVGAGFNPAPRRAAADTAPRAPEESRDHDDPDRQDPVYDPERGAGRAVLLEAVAVAPELPLRHAQQVAGLQHR